MKMRSRISRQVVRNLSIACVVALAIGLIPLAGCCQESEKKPRECKPVKTKAKEDATPEWSYDAPFYVRPADGMPPITSFDRDPVEVYTRKRILQVPRPCIGDSRKAPRIALWMSKDRGIHWERIGYFGIQQSYFHYRLDKDGHYGIRFIGPGIPPAQCKPPKPHMLYIVDTKSPAITVYVRPDEEVYTVGQIVTVEWSASDPHLKPDSVKINLCVDCGCTTDELPWKCLGENLPVEGSMDIQIPADAVGKKLTIRVSALDKAGNLGHGFSCPLPVVEPEPEPTTQPSTQPATQPASKK